MKRVFIDTGAWYAHINKNDPLHSRVFTFIKDPDRQLITSNYVFDETITLVRARLGHPLAVKAGQILRDACEVSIVWITPTDEEEAWRLFMKRRDKSYSFTDCTSFVLMRRLKIQHCLFLDRHFQQEGFTNVI